MYLFKLVAVYMKGQIMLSRRRISNREGTILLNYETLLDALIDETRRLLVEKKKKNLELKKKNQEYLFEQFIYINSLRNTARTEKEYKEAYEILSESIQKFRDDSA